MAYRPRWDSGDWIAICDVCGRKFKASRLMKRWDGMMTCPDDWEPRQPQDFVRGVADFQAPPYTRPEPQDDFVEIKYTEQPVDIVVPDETINKHLIKYIPDVSFTPPTTVNAKAVDVGTLNGGERKNPKSYYPQDVLGMVLNSAMVNVNTHSNGPLIIQYPETINVSDSYKLVNETFYNDTFGISDSVAISIFYGISSALNRPLLNSTVLG